jgi:hypothetical protein
MTAHKREHTHVAEKASLPARMWESLNTRRARKMRARAISYVAMALAILFFSTQLQELSVSALWLPTEWRAGVQISSTLIGMILFQYALKRCNPPVEHAAHDKMAEHHHHLRRHLTALWWALGTLGCLALYLSLRTICVLDWDSRTWEDNEIAADIQSAVARHPATTTASTHGEGEAESHASHPATAEHVSAEEPHASEPAHDIEGLFARIYHYFVGRHAERDASGLAGVIVERYPHVANKPDFVDLHKHKVYIPLPLLIPQEQTDYIRRIGKEHDQDGLDYILREEPDHLFNWLSIQLRVRLLLTTLTFLILHILTIVCFSLAVGYAYGPLEATLFFLEGH